MKIFKNPECVQTLKYNTNLLALHCFIYYIRLQNTTKLFVLHVYEKLSLGLLCSYQKHIPTDMPFQDLLF